MTDQISTFGELSIDNALVDGLWAKFAKLKPRQVNCSGALSIGGVRGCHVFVVGYPYKFQGPSRSQL